MKELTKANLYLKLFGLLKIPLIFFCRPKVVEISSQKITVKIPLRRRTKNHLNSMYFGVLAVGADVAGGLIAMKLINEKKLKISLVFKDFKADFLKRPEGDVYFTCEDGDLIASMLEQAVATGERIEKPVNVTATVPSVSSEPVARFILTLSLKQSKKEPALSTR
jgi:acyl-coenzyme A thioesterase PaaI-like protein